MRNEFFFCVMDRIRLQKYRIYSSKKLLPVMDLGRSWTKIPNSLDCYNLRLPSIIVMTALHNDLHTIGFAAWWCRNCYETQFSLVWLMNRATNNNGVLCFVCSLVFSQAVNREYGMVTSHFGTRTLRYQDISVPLTWSRSVRTVRVWSRIAALQPCITDLYWV